MATTPLFATLPVAGKIPAPHAGNGLGLATLAILDEAAELVTLNAVHPSGRNGTAPIEALWAKLGGCARSSGQHQRQKYTCRHEPRRRHRPDHNSIQVGPALGRSPCRHDGLPRHSLTSNHLRPKRQQNPWWMSQARTLADLADQGAPSSTTAAMRKPLTISRRHPPRQPAIRAKKPSEISALCLQLDR